MIVIEAKLKGTRFQYSKLDEAIRTGQFIRNTCLRYWEVNIGITRNDLQKLCSVLAKNKETPWSKKLNSQARQAHADRERCIPIKRLDSWVVGNGKSFLRSQCSRSYHLPIPNPVKTDSEALATLLSRPLACNS